MNVTLMMIHVNRRLHAKKNCKHQLNFIFFSLSLSREEKKIRLIFYRFILFQNNSCAASFCWGEFVLNRIYVRRIWDMELLFFRRWNNCKYLFANYVLMWNKFSPNSILREWDMRRTFGAGHKKTADASKLERHTHSVYTLPCIYLFMYGDGNDTPTVNEIKCCESLYFIALKFRWERTLETQTFTKYAH